MDSTNHAFANAYGLRVEAVGGSAEGELEAIFEALRDVRTGKVQSAFVADLDGNLVKMQFNTGVWLRDSTTCREVDYPRCVVQSHIE
jgi:hypothetical protein